MDSNRHSDKKRSKEDTWKAADLKRYIGEDGHRDGRRRDDRRPRGDSVEKHYRDPDKESRREGDKNRNYNGDRGDTDEMNKYVERRKEGSRDRRDERDKDRERRKERDRIGDRKTDDYREKIEKRNDREEIRHRERDKDRQREKDRAIVSEKYSEEERAKRREEREREKRREEQEREHRHDRERRKHDVGSEYIKHNREQRDRHRERDGRKDEYEVSRSEKDRRDRERHAERKHAEKEYREDHRKDKDDREKRYKEQRYHDEKKKHHRESTEHRDRKRSEEEGRHHRSDREEAGRDKHRERRHKEEKETERNSRDRTQAKEKSEPPDLSHTQKTDKTQKDDDEDEPEQDYEDDFEDYEEDFEELDDSDTDNEEKQELVEEKEELPAEKKEEILAIQRAMDEENKKVGALSRQNTAENEEDRPKWSRESERTQSKTSQRGKFMDFVAAKQREVNKKVATKQKKRSTELLRLIDLDFTLTSSLLDLPPVNEYDMYIRNFGTANTKQAYVQCNEDNTDRDIQTEEIELSEKWTQHPPDHTGACGDPNISQQERDNEINIDSKRLTSFMHSASQVMIVLLEEDRAERNSLRKLKTQADVLSFSDGSLQLNTKLPFLNGRYISLTHFSQVQKHTMMTVHSPKTKPGSARLDSHSIICIWNIWEPSRPQRILLYESEVQCCCFSPGKATLVFAGTTVGSVVLWDLREQTSNHYHMTFGEEEWTFRQPSFSTDAVMAASGHFTTVMSVEVLPSAVPRGQRSEVPFLASEEEASGLSFQLASLDESGILNIWVVVELPKAIEAGSQIDLGLRPGGKVKLLHSSSVSIADRISQKAKKTAPLQTLQLQFLPTDSSHFFVGTNMGFVHHGTSHGLKSLPKLYRYQDGEKRPVDINSVNFSPFRQDLFLVSCGDGCIRLHAVSQEQPLFEWRNGFAGLSVISVQWSQTRPAVFCVLDAGSNIHLWDLLKNETQPVHTERMETDRVTAMAVFGDSGRQNTYSGVALAHESGKIEIQYFSKDFTVPGHAEEEKFNSLISDIL